MELMLAVGLQKKIVGIQAVSPGQLSQRHINSYFAYSAMCKRTAPVTDFSVVYKDLENYGKIFDVQGSADSVVAQMQRTVTAVQKKVAGLAKPKVFVYSWENEQGKAYATGNQDLANAAILAAGGQNLFGDVNACAKEVGWEDVVARNPDVIVITPYGKATQTEYNKVVAKAEAFFTSNPALKNVNAVKNRKFVIAQDARRPRAWTPGLLDADRTRFRPAEALRRADSGSRPRNFGGRHWTKCRLRGT